MLRTLYAALVAVSLSIITFTSSALAVEGTHCTSLSAAEAVATGYATADTEVDEGPYFEAFDQGICDMRMVNVPEVTTVLQQFEGEDGVYIVRQLDNEYYVISESN